MRPNRSLLLMASTALVLFLVGGGVAVKIGAEPNRFDQPVLFAEIVALVLENYVDPVDPEGLLRGAYEGLLSGLDPNGAYLSPREVAEWKAGASKAGAVDPGLTVLKGGRNLQVISVEPGSPAAEAGIKPGDQIRTLNDRPARDLSLAQARRLLRGPAGTKVSVGLLHPSDEFSREVVELERRAPTGPAYRLDVEEGVALLTVQRMGAIPVDRLAEELDDVRSRGIDRLLIDLRNVADGGPEDAIEVAGLFVPHARLVLRDKAHELIREHAASRDHVAWSGRVALLTNGASAGSAEALASLLHGQDAELLGQSTFGYGAEADLIELRSGAGLLVSVAVWETDAGDRWNETGLEPDQEVVGSGDTAEAVAGDQLRRALELMQEAEPVTRPARAA